MVFGEEGVVREKRKRAVWWYWFDRGQLGSGQKVGMDWAELIFGLGWASGVTGLVWIGFWFS